MRTGDGRNCVGFDIGLINRKRMISRRTMAAFAQDGRRIARRRLQREFADCHIFVMRHRATGLFVANHGMLLFTATRATTTSFRFFISFELALSKAHNGKDG
jgi:hypothetical protein